MCRVLRNVCLTRACACHTYQYWVAIEQTCFMIYITNQVDFFFANGEIITQ